MSFIFLLDFVYFVWFVCMFLKVVLIIDLFVIKLGLLMDKLRILGIVLVSVLILVRMFIGIC